MEEMVATWCASMPFFWLGDNASHIAKDGGAITNASSSHPWWKPSRIWWGVYWSYAPKRMAFSEMGLSLIFRFEASWLTHDVYKPQILLRMTSWLIKVSAGAQPWMNEACFMGSMFLLNGNKKCDWHALAVSA
jgi:hypothetical protein